MYKVSVADILKEIGKKKIIEENIPLRDEDDLYKLNCLAHVQLIAENVGELVLVTGQAQAEIELKCVRCNTPINTALKINAIEQEYNYEDKLLHFNKEDKNVGMDELRFIIDEKGEIDIEDLLKQEIILALPLKPICNNCHNAVSYSTGENK